MVRVKGQNVDSCRVVRIEEFIKHLLATERRSHPNDPEDTEN